MITVQMWLFVSMIVALIGASVYIGILEDKLKKKGKK